MVTTQGFFNLRTCDSWEPESFDQYEETWHPTFHAFYDALSFTKNQSTNQHLIGSPVTLTHYDKSKLIELVKQESLRVGSFTLASGRTASYYLDCRCVTLHPQGANQIALGILAEMSQWGWLPQAVGGMAIGADPITAAIVTIAGQRDQSLRGFMVRKEPKGHGTGQQVEGPVEPGQSVVIVEDVITSGGSAIKAAEICRAFGLNVLGVIAVVDRLAGGEKAFAAAGLSLKTLLTIRDLGLQPE